MPGVRIRMFQQIIGHGLQVQPMKDDAGIHKFHFAAASEGSSRFAGFWSGEKVIVFPDFHEMNRVRRERFVAGIAKDDKPQIIQPGPAR